LVERVLDVYEVRGPSPLPPTMEQKIIYEDENVLVIDKPAGVNSDDFPKRVHRLDKDTSGILLIAKDQTTLEFLQKQFENRQVQKKYIALIVGHLKSDTGTIETLIDRAPGDRRKQKVYLEFEPGAEDKRRAITSYQLLQRLENYDLIEVEPKTGRKHQIRAHFVYLGHPLAGDKLYCFKNQPCPKGLARQFLHAGYLAIKMPDGQKKEFQSDLPKDLKEALEKIT
jgi:23S rRNA pseudouridine1911/1915/1917 synthase